MIKKVRSSFSIKVFLFTSLILILSNVIVLIVMYSLMPQLYKKNATKRLIDFGEGLYTEVKDKTESGFGEILNEYCEMYDVQVSVSDAEGQPVDVPELAQKYILKEDVAEPGDVYLFAGEEAGFYGFSIHTQNGHEYNITATATDQEWLKLAFNDLKGLLPVLLLVITAIAFCVSVVYTKWVTGPVLKLTATAAAMAEMRWEDARTAIDRQDEIGALARNINDTSKKLEMTLLELDRANQTLQERLNYQMQLDEEQKSFFAAASHELKIPLTILKGQITGMLYHVGIYADRDTFLRKAMNTVEEMEQRVLKILDVARLENKDVTVQLEKTNLFRIVQQTLEMYEDLISDKNMELSVDIPCGLYIWADKKLLLKAIQNILQNAVKYSPQDAKIRIQGGIRKQQCRLSVENTGVWLPEGKEKELFRAFYRVEESRNMQSGGSGLGLFIVKKALECQKISYGIHNTEEGVLFEMCFDQYETSDKLQENHREDTDGGVIV